MSELKYGKLVDHKFDEEYKGVFVGKIDRNKNKVVMTKIKSDVYKELTILKAQLGFKSISDLIAYKVFGIDNRREK